MKNDSIPELIMLSVVALISEVFSKLTLTAKTETTEDDSSKDKVSPPEQVPLSEQEEEIVLYSDPTKEIITISN